MAIFKLNPNGFSEVRNKTIINSSVFGLSAGAAGILISSQSNDPQPGSIYISIFMMLMLLGIVGNTQIKIIKRLRQQWESYQLTINDENVIQTQAGFPDMEIPKAEIREVIEFLGGAIIIKTALQESFIAIPSAINDREDVLRELSSIVEISRQQTSRYGIYNLLTSIITFGLMVLHFTTRTKVILIITGVILVLGLAYSYATIQNSSHVDQKTKRWSHAILFLIISLFCRLSLAFII